MARQAEHILVVEDDPPIADLLRIFLEMEGYQVSVALTGAQAIQLLGEQSFDLTTLDLALPDIDGLQVLQAIRANPATRDLPVVVVTAYPYLLGGAQVAAVLTKPPDVTQLLMTVRRALAASPEQKGTR
ncbi:MAG: response regulator [Chloroflexi bacterium]|nr:response regulator [Chloroflexota bacterium]